MIALLTATGAGAAAPPAAAAAPADGPAAALIVAPDDGGIVRSGRDLGVTITVTNTGSERLAAGRIALSLQQEPVASTSTLLAEIAKPSQVLLGILTPTTAEVPALGAGADATVRARVDDAVLSSILSPASGARLLYTRYTSGTLKAFAESSVVRMASTSAATVGLGVVIPVLAPAGTTGVVDAATQQTLAAADGAWGRALRAAEADPAATIALDPAVLASIRLAGDPATSAGGFLDALERLQNQVIRLPYADGDVTLQRAAGRSSTVAPSSFAGIAVAATQTATPTPTPAGTAGTGTDAAEDLTAWNWSDQAVVWPVPHTASARAVTALGAEGAAVLLPSDDVRDTAERRTAGPVAVAGSARLLVADATASALLLAASADGPSGQAALSTLTGLLATAAVTNETTAVLATVGRTGDTGRLDRALALLGRQPWIVGRSLFDLAGQQQQEQVQIAQRSVPSERVNVARSLLSAERAVQQLGRSITTDAAVVTDPQRLALAGLLSAGWRSDDTGWRRAAGAAETAFEDVVGQVHLTEGSENTAIGTDGVLRVTVVNDLPEPVSMVVRVSAGNGRLQFDGGETTVAVPAGGQNAGKLPYRSITNGRTTVALTLETKDGAVVDDGVRQFTVRAGFDTIVAVVLLTALGLLLALGVYRNVTRRRQPRTATPA